MATDERLMLAQRSLIGLAVGDAFGETMFGQPQEVARRAAKRLISTKRPWRWTDDTAMALSIVEVLGRRGTMPTLSPRHSHAVGHRNQAAATVRALSTC